MSFIRERDFRRWRMAFRPSKSLDRKKGLADASRVHNFFYIIRRDPDIAGKPAAARARRIDVQTQDRRSGGAAGL